MKRLLILAVLLGFMGCTAPEIQKPPWVPETSIYTDNNNQFFDKDKPTEKSQQ
jgi:hypothetical protein